MGSIILIFVLAISASLVPGGVTQDPPATFFVISPNVFRAGVEEKVVVTLIRSPPNVQNIEVKVSLMRPGSTVTFSEDTRLVSPGSSQSFSVVIQAGDLMRNEGAFQHMVLKAESLNPIYPFEEQTDILVTLQSGYVFVQTDKPIYTPNQDVMIKVMSLDQDMLPSDRELHVEIMDPSGTSVKRLRETHADVPASIGRLQVHNHPASVNGPFRLSMDPSSLSSQVTFVVKEYVLPTFSVSIETPKYILAGADSVVSTIIAEYVFGKPVIGRYTFKYGVVDNGTVQELGTKQGLLGDSGRAEVTLDDLSTDFGEDWFVRFRGRHFHANAIVHESATQFSEASINTKAIFVDSPYKFSTKRTVQHFKAGLNLQVKLDLTFANGDVAPNVPVNVIATATLRDGSEELLRRPDIAGGQEEISNTDDQGGVSMVLNVQSSITSIHIVAATHDPQYPNNQADISFEVSPGVSANGHDYLVIRPQNTDDRNLNVDVSTDFLIQRIGTTGDQDIDLHFLCITGGKVVLEGVQRSISAAGTNLAITIRAYMAPQMRLIVYYVTMDGSVIADSLLLGVEEKCRQDPQLSLDILPRNVGPERDVYEPNGQIQVEVTAPIDSNVGLLAVDKAVYLLRDKDRMGKQKMYERMRSYDTGCGPGGGQNTAQIFKDCGMTVLTNAGLDVPIREDVECMDEDTRRKRSIDRDQLCLYDPTYLADCLADKPRLRRVLTEGGWLCPRRARVLEAECNLEPDQTQVYRDCCINSMNPVVTATSRSGGDGGEQNAAVKVRDDFRETWFFDVVSMPEDGSPYLYPVSIPSSITDWHLTAVSLSPTQGMCVEDETTVSVFQDFFIQLHLPYSVVRLEQTQVIATIFNYGFSDFEVSVNFTVDQGLCTAENPAIRHVFVESKRAASTTFHCTPCGSRGIPYTVTAGGSKKRDSVRNNLRVVSQGVMQRKSRSLTLNPGRVMFSDDVTTPSPNNSLGSGPGTIFGEGFQHEEIAISLPGSSIPDTESCSVKLIGNLLGTASTDPIGGLDHLVRQPRGCGEQTMIYLAPTLFVYQYLIAVGSDTAEQEARIYDYIADGVARELTYRQDNGAYAAWKHRPGSTWLTAFVVKVFSQANRFTRVEPGHVEGSINWLIDNNQLPSGAFQESQQVIHQEMIGAVKGETSMTAFVLISLLESRNLLVPANQKIDEAIGKATEYLVTQVENIDRVYDKALVTSALRESASVGTANGKLWEDRNEDGTGAVSFTPDDANYEDGSQPFWLQRKPSAIEIETSGYALLAQLALLDYQKAGKIALWLSKQQNDGGGFVSPQDTVVALQALAKYTERPEFNTIEMNCDVATEQIPLHRYHIGNDNAKVQEEVDVSPSIGRSLTFDSRGTGVAKANVELRYNTEKSDIDTCPFHLNISAVEVPSDEVSGQNVKGLMITVCTSYNGDGTTHMIIVDVGLYSGFKAVEEGLTGLKQVVNGSSLISSYEASSRSVIFYLDTIPSDEDLCFTFSAESDVVVGNVQAAAVHVYDYYDPEKSCTIFYKPGDGSALLSTLCSENECICSGGSLEYCNIDPCPGPYTRIDLEGTACASHSSYALKIRIDEVEIKEGFRICKFTVLNPIKTGDEDVPHQAQRQLFINEGCDCPKVKGRNIGGTFLLVGQKSLKYTTEQGEERYRYVYGPTSKLEFWPATRKARNAAVFDKLVAFEAQMAPASACSNEN
ncbi:complement component C3 precursor [Strongylocentrotus purpuratus]|uniref:Complement component C3 n=1 Tax=Strongylocentrotus purpuratus TaxID=7668 RepID=O44344_STRPU|nr:complement component C3 precursor [Strongylocentrotus purpuratus]AAC14396.1 complement component C3 [Strongylocentrotus purpuratus]|eukprot:NP_999686.1 complement component C3 precursor [Strongylocentrotus purpuratus]